MPRCRNIALEKSSLSGGGGTLTHFFPHQKNLHRSTSVVKSPYKNHHFNRGGGWDLQLTPKEHNKVKFQCQGCCSSTALFAKE